MHVYGMAVILLEKLDTIIKYPVFFPSVGRVDYSHAHLYPSRREGDVQVDGCPRRLASDIRRWGGPSLERVLAANRDPSSWPPSSRMQQNHVNPVIFDDSY